MSLEEQHREITSMIQRVQELRKSMWGRRKVEEAEDAAVYVDVARQHMEQVMGKQGKGMAA